MHRILQIVISLLLCCCSGKKIGVEAHIGIAPSLNEVRVFGQDTSRNLLYLKNGNEQLANIIEKRLRDKGLLDGAEITSNYNPNIFVNGGAKGIDTLSKPNSKKSFYFSREETALTIIDGKGWVLVSVDKW